MRMRSIGRTAVVVFGVIGVLSVSGDLSAARNARAVFKKTKHDFGKVKQGNVVTYEFLFTNEGDDVLRVDRVDTSCGCTAALVSAKKIEPGGQGKIKVTLDTQLYTGRLTKYIFVSSNDSRQPRRELSVTVDIEAAPSPRIELDKYNIDLGLSLEGESPSVKVRIKSVGERELRVEIAPHPEIKFYSDGKSLQFPLRLPAGNSAEVEFRFEPQARTGILRDYILIRSNDPIRSSYSVFISRYVITRQELKALFEKYKGILEIRKSG